MKSSREQFEEWYKKSMMVRVAWYGEENIKSDLVCEDDGTYTRVSVRDKWDAWQASRAEIEIEMPTVIWDMSEDGSQHYDRDEVIDAIQSAGIKVKS